MLTAERITCLLAFVFLFSVNQGLGQALDRKAKLDSLIAAIETMPEDTNKVLAFASVSRQKLNVSLEEALEYCERGLALAEKLEWDQGRINLIMRGGNCHRYMGDLAKALSYYERAKAIAEENNDRGAIASIKNEFAVVYYEKADYPQALIFYQESLDYAEETNDSIKIARRLNNMGNTYFAMADYPRALEYHNRALLIKQKLHERASISSSLENIGLVYLRQADYPKALSYFHKSLLIRKEIGFEMGIFRSLLHIGIVYTHQSDYARALENFEAAYQKAESIGDRRNMAIILSNMAEVYEDLQEYQKALEYNQRALQINREVEDTYGMASNLDNIGIIHRERSAYLKSLEFHTKALQIRDSISDQRGISVTLNNMGLVYMNQSKHEIAQTYYKQSLTIARELGILDMQANALSNLTESYKAIGNTAEALKTYEEFVVVEDSIYNTENSRKIAQIEEKAKYDQQRQMDSLAFILEKVRIEQDNQQKLAQRNYLLVGVLGLGLITFLFFRYRQQVRNRENELKLQQEQERKEQLEDLDKLKSRFFANISHEFRTPLTLILGPASDLYQKVNSSSEKRELGLIRNNAQRLLRLVNQILDLSRLESGKFELKLMEDDIVSFSRRITASFQSWVENLDIQLDFDSRIAQLETPFDPDILEKTWVNLIANAIKYTPRGGQIVAFLKEEKNRIYMGVSDTGVGIAANHLPHVFDRFYQAESDKLTTHEASTGIGLALVKELIELHSGKITVESKQDVGTTFSFWIPKGKAAYRSEDFVHYDTWELSQDHNDISADISPLAIPSSPMLSTDESRESVLIIEDNPDVRTYLKKCLGETYQIIEAFDGKEGVDIAIREIPDLIITDVMMPHKDGFEVTQELKANKLTHHIPIIILTGKSSRESKLEGLEKEAEEFLTKPFDAEELRLRIQGLLNNRRRLQEKFSSRLLLETSEVEVSSKEEMFLREAIAIVESNLGNEDFSIEQMASELHISRVQLFRKLKALTNQSPSRFIRSIRLKRAKQLIEGEAGTIAEIAYSVGFASPTYFGKCFKEQYGTAPGDLLISES